LPPGRQLATIAAMCLPHLTSEQADRLRAQIGRHTDYLQRLVDRMRKLRWWDDPMWDATHKALAAMVQLRAVAQGVGFGVEAKPKDSPQ
jgi:hypothetical protein